MYKFLIRPFLFLFDTEKVHHFTFTSLKIIFKIPLMEYFSKKIFQVKDKNLESELFGLTFKNPIGLAAGFDKNAKYMDVMRDLGFGFMEIGTVTPKPQAGNPKPRLFRVKKDKAIINRMGFTVTPG